VRFLRKRKHFDERTGSGGIESGNVSRKLIKTTHIKYECIVNRNVTTSSSEAAVSFNRMAI